MVFETAKLFNFANYGDTINFLHHIGFIVNLDGTFVRRQKGKRSNFYDVTKPLVDCQIRYSRNLDDLIENYITLVPRN